MSLPTRTVIGWAKVNADGSIAASAGISGVSNVSTTFTYTLDVQNRGNDANVAANCSIFSTDAAAYTSIALSVVSEQVVGVDVDEPTAAFDFEIVRYS